MPLLSFVLNTQYSAAEIRMSVDFMFHYYSQTCIKRYPLGMAYWPVNTGWHFNRGLKNLRVFQENKGSQRAKHLSHDKLTSTCFYLFLDQKKKV